jgi:hypothetical protein
MNAKHIASACDCKNANAKTQCKRINAVVAAAAAAGV